MVKFSWEYTTEHNLCVHIYWQPMHCLALLGITFRCSSVGNAGWECTHLVTTDHSGMLPIHSVVISNSYCPTHYSWSLYSARPLEGSVCFYYHVAPIHTVPHTCGREVVKVSRFSQDTGCSQQTSISLGFCSLIVTRYSAQISSVCRIYVWIYVSSSLEYRYKHSAAVTCTHTSIVLQLHVLIQA